MRTCTVHSIKDLRGHFLVLFAGVTKQRSYTSNWKGTTITFCMFLAIQKWLILKWKLSKKNSLKMIPRMLITCVHNAIFFLKSQGRKVERNTSRSNPSLWYPSFFLDKTDIKHVLYKPQMTFKTSKYSVYGFLSIINNSCFSI